MRIPKQIKIGGRIYTVEITDNLKLGSSNYTAECDYEELKIRLVTYTSDNKRQSDLIHEMIHAIADNLGYINHTERDVEAFAQVLYAVIQDNPKMFESEVNKNECR